MTRCFHVALEARCGAPVAQPFRAAVAGHRRPEGLRYRRFVPLAFAFAVVARAAFAQELPPTTVSGTVSIAGPDGAPLVVPGVTVTLTCGGGDPRVDVSNEQGGFSFADVAGAGGACSIVAELQGFSSAKTDVALGAKVFEKSCATFAS